MRLCDVFVLCMCSQDAEESRRAPAPHSHRYASLVVCTAASQLEFGSLIVLVQESVLFVRQNSKILLLAAQQYKQAGANPSVLVYCQRWGDL